MIDCTADTKTLANILESSHIHQFADPMANAASQRVSQRAAQIIRDHALAMITGTQMKELSVAEQIFFLTDCVIVGEAVTELLQTNDDVRARVVAVGGAELLGRCLVQQQTAVRDVLNQLAAVKAQLN